MKESSQEQLQLYNFIKNKEYMTSQDFNSDSKSLMKLVRFVQNLQVNPESFDFAKSLIKFYRIPIMIAFEPFYNKLQENYTENIEKYQTQIKQIAGYVKSYLENYKLQQLNFFYVLGIGKKKKALGKSAAEIQFIEYIQELGKDINKLKANSKKMEPEQLKLELDSILARSFDRKMNPLEKNYERYFKMEADKIYHENQKIIEAELESKDLEKKSLESKPYPVEEVVQHLCCRRFFYDRELIKQPQNLILEYKNYSFPFDDTRAKILKKTFCAFLNTNGGIIFLGIHQNVDTKMRKVFGMQLNEAEKQKLLVGIRMIAQSIEPDIISNKMYTVEFVPIKSSYNRNNYIAGRYLVKINLKFGIRDEIYSYKDDHKDYFAFRTQNEVIHREGREVLNALRDRIKNPLSEPIPLHEGPCPPPQQGCQIYDQSYMYKQRRDNKANKLDFPSISSFQKQKYKQKDAMDYIICNIKQKQLLKLLRSNNILEFVKLIPQKNDVILMKVIDNKEKERIHKKLIQFQDQNKLEIFVVGRGLQVDKVMESVVYDILQHNNIKFDQVRQKNLFKLKNSEDAISTFLILMEFGANPAFVEI